MSARKGRHGVGDREESALYLSLLQARRRASRRRTVSLLCHVAGHCFLFRRSALGSDNTVGVLMRVAFAPPLEEACSPVHLLSVVLATRAAPPPRRPLTIFPSLACCLRHAAPELEPRKHRADHYEGRAAGIQQVVLGDGETRKTRTQFTHTAGGKGGDSVVRFCVCSKKGDLHLAPFSPTLQSAVFHDTACCTRRVLTTAH